MNTATKESDEVKIILPSHNHDDLWFFTSSGRVFQMPTYEIPEATRIAKGQPIVNLLNLGKDETVEMILDSSKASEKYLFLCTRK